MDIRTEFELVQKLSEKLAPAFNTDTVVREFSGGYGIADLVFAKNFFAEENILEREPINNYLCVKILLSFSQRETFSLEEITPITGASRNTNISLIKYLIERNYLVKTPRGLYKRSYVLKNPIKKIVAVEVKLRDWKQGALQARRYKSFTDESYLAILAKHAQNVDMNFLYKFGIGLILFSPETGDISFKTRPKLGQFLSVYEESRSVFAKESFLYQATSRTA